jgi:hypothetical protein
VKNELTREQLVERLADTTASAPRTSCRSLQRLGIWPAPHSDCLRSLIVLAVALGWKTLGAIAGAIILLGGVVVAIRELGNTGVRSNSGCGPALLASTWRAREASRASAR